jgi:hypothetical protein
MRSIQIFRIAGANHGHNAASGAFMVDHGDCR